MSVGFRHRRTVPVALGSPDNADPNTFSSAADLAALAARSFVLGPANDLGDRTAGHNLVLVGKDGAAGAGADVADFTATITVWAKDESETVASGQWFIVDDAEACTHRRLKLMSGIK